ncbi:MAG TPA: GTP-binding protein [Caldimonas sp.]|jgi:sulfate adenylyltransferase subunit 1|nr:GTP-binding protein [Caldimonas sp.]HEV7575157.1 GTP-binding protein [Caldimonas sp.]
MGFALREDDPAPAARRPLRFLTAGSVDDGKSTLIGRLLLDNRAILADQLDALEARAGGGQAIDLALLTDGLEAEREQGITIDVAYRYFATRERKFIIADAPGHEQYTRNMVTAAAGSDAAVVLVDATKLDLAVTPLAVAEPLELLPQTRRHALLAQLLRVPHIVFAVNKLDAVADAKTAFARVRAALVAFAADAGFVPAGIVPISALHGDNVSRPSALAGYEGPTLLSLLEQLADDDDATRGAVLVPVQYVGADAGHGAAGHRPRVLWGRVARGEVVVGDLLAVFPSGETARVAELHDAGTRVESVAAGRSAGVVLDRQLDVSRGDWLAAPGSVAPSARFRATLAWLDAEPAIVGRKYWLRHGNRWLHGRIAAIDSKLDIATLAAHEAHELGVNEIGAVIVETQQPLPIARFADDRVAGALLVVDPATNRTSGTLLVRESIAS